MSSHIHFRSKYAGKLRTSVFQDFHKTDPAELRVSTFNTSTCITLPPSMWQQITNGKRKKTPLVCMTNLDFPKELKQKYLEQLDKVYTKCIFPGQFLPQLFNESNAASSSKQDCIFQKNIGKKKTTPIHIYTAFHSTAGTTVRNQFTNTT